MCNVPEEKGENSEVRWYSIAQWYSNLPNDIVIKSPEKGESYKYLGVLEADKVMVDEMSYSTTKEWEKCWKQCWIVGMSSKLLTPGQ